jgi:hypothetical protein
MIFIFEPISRCVWRPSICLGSLSNTSCFFFEPLIFRCVWPHFKRASSYLNPHTPFTVRTVLEWNAVFPISAETSSVSVNSHSASFLGDCNETWGWVFCYVHMSYGSARDESSHRWQGFDMNVCMYLQVYPRRSLPWMRSFIDSTPSLQVQLFSYDDQCLVCKYRTVPSWPKVRVFFCYFFFFR